MASNPPHQWHHRAIPIHVDFTPAKSTKGTLVQKACGEFAYPGYAVRGQKVDPLLVGRVCQDLGYKGEGEKKVRSRPWPTWTM